MGAVSSTLAGTCPKCEKGKIFSSRGNIFMLKVPKMNTECPNCGYVFEKEPGYFLGAMYVSYALTIIEMLLMFAVFFAFVPIWAFFLIILGGMVLLSFFNFRTARIVWIHMFTN